MRDYLALIAPGVTGNRCDVTPLFADADGFSWLVDDLIAMTAALEYDLIAGIDALGFVIGAAIATRGGVGFLAIRKGGKYPVPVERVKFVDYSGEEKTLELRRGAVCSGARVLIIDEWIETGAQVAAAARLIESQGGVVAGIATINCDESAKTLGLRGRYPVFAVSAE